MSGNNKDGFYAKENRGAQCAPPYRFLDISLLFVGANSVRPLIFELKLDLSTD
jgi:hypothetical protein